MATTRRGFGAGRPRRTLASLPFLLPGSATLIVFVAFPVLLILLYSFLKRNRFGGIEFSFTFDNYLRVLDDVYLKVIGDSFVTALAVTALALLLGYPTALVIARLPARWQTIALLAVLLPFWTNFLIRAYALILLLNNAGWLNGALQGLGITQEPISILYTPAAVITGLLYLYIPLMILPLYSSLTGQDPLLAEAATNLGASPWRVFRTVTLPLSTPGILTGCVFVMVPCMGNFVIPELLGGGMTTQLGNLIRDQFLKARDWPFGSTLAIALFVFLIVLLVLQQVASRRVSEGSRA